MTRGPYVEPVAQQFKDRGEALPEAVQQCTAETRIMRARPFRDAVRRQYNCLRHGTNLKVLGLSCTINDEPETVSLFESSWDKVQAICRNREAKDFVIKVFLRILEEGEDLWEAVENGYDL